VNPAVRLPRNYDRFIGLIEQLFEAGKIPPTGKALLVLERRSLEELLSELKPTRTILFTHQGKPELLSNIADKLVKEERPVAVIGGFPRGHFSEKVRELVDEQLCIDPEALEAWVVASKLIHEYERAIGLHEKRLRRIKR
jgi:rRNA small subunit pseudouridine methyltransferase Nep1